MLRAFLLLLSVSCAALHADAQTYAERFKLCSGYYPITDSTADSLYTELLLKRDSCLTGSVAPALKARSVAGKIVDLSALRGQVIVLNFWSVGCGPCVAEMPVLNQLVKYYAGKQVSFISLASENTAALKKFFTTHSFLYTTIPDADRFRTDIFKLEGISPYHIIIDKAGKIHTLWFGGFDNVKDNLPFTKTLLISCCK